MSTAVSMRQPLETTPRGNGVQRAATLLIGLGPDTAAGVFKHLKEDEIEQLTTEIARQRTISAAERNQAFQDFYRLFLAHQYISQGGTEFARELLERGLGKAKAQEIMARLTANLQTRPLDKMRRTDPGQLAGLLQDEHPQTVAVVLAHLLPDQAAVVLAALPPERQADVARRIAIMDRTSPEVLREVERVLERKLSSLVNHDYSAAGGLEWVAQVLNQVDRATEKAILDTLSRQDPTLAEEIKKRILMFEDVVHLDNRSLQRVLREVDSTRDLPLALKVSSEEVKGKVLGNISRRAADALKENIELMGPVRLRDVEEAQARIVAVIRRLEEAGEIVLSRGGGGDILV